MGRRRLWSCAGLPPLRERRPGLSSMGLSPRRARALRRLGHLLHSISVVVVSLLLCVCSRVRRWVSFLLSACCCRLCVVRLLLVRACVVVVVAVVVIVLIVLVVLGVLVVARVAAVGTGRRET